MGGGWLIGFFFSITPGWAWFLKQIYLGWMPIHLMNSSVKALKEHKVLV